MMTEHALSTVLPDPTGAEGPKAIQVRQMFDRIAGTYDTLNDWISMGCHRRWKRLACQQLHLKPGAHVLDVCTGTGDLAGYLLPLTGPKGQVEGLDFSENMLSLARKRYEGIPNIHFTQGDALALPYPEHHFDGVIISFGLRNVTNIPQALTEMYRVLKPGGWMVNLDTCPTPKLPGMHFYFSRIMPLIGKALSQDEQAYRYLSESTKHFLTPSELKAAFEGVGCTDVNAQALMLGSVSLQAGRKKPFNL
jgi:demethylmenaquinone methyltransferase/2-methoxy-6-polyprenyl-1,4-benzoquinol methylase